MYRKFALILILVLVSAAVFAAPEFYADDIYFDNVVDFGVGGPYPTDNEGLSTLLTNPGAIRSADKDFTLLGLTLHTTGPVIDIYNLFAEASATGQDMSAVIENPDMVTTLQSVLEYTGLSVTGPLYTGYIGERFGFGLFNSTDFLFQTTGPLSLSIGLSEEVVAAAGYSFRLPLSKDESEYLDLGFSVKGGVAADITIEKSFLELPTMFDSLGPGLIMGQPMELTQFISADAGLLYAMSEHFSVGASVQDLFSLAVRQTYTDGINGFTGTEQPEPEYGVIPLKLNAGVEWNPTIPLINFLITDFRVMAGYNDILDFMLYPSEAENFLLHLQGGVEMTLLSIFDFRVGMSEGLLNAGMGLDFKFMTIDAAVFGTERASQPNTNPVYNMSFGITF